MRRVVLDTNVFVAAAFNPGSSAARLVESIRADRLQMVWDKATRRETQSVLTRIPRLDWDDFAPLFRPDREWCAETCPQRFCAVSDPGDRKFAALACAARAVLITNDAHLLDAAGVEGLDVMTPRRFLELEAGRL
jgi:uncharacterized protein